MRLFPCHHYPRQLRLERYVCGMEYANTSQNLRIDIRMSSNAYNESIPSIGYSEAMKESYTTSCKATEGNRYATSTVCVRCHLLRRSFAWMQ